MLKNPDWGMMIVSYFFLGGIAGGAYFAAAIADNFGGPGDRRVVRIGYVLATLLTAACGLLLIADLGVPSRFLNMLRVFRFWNPMSVGAWVVGLFGMFAFASSVLSFWPAGEGIAPLRRKISFVGMFFGFFLASYTGVLLSNSAQPLWSEGRLMGALFLVSGASTGLAAISLLMAVTGASPGDGWTKVKRADRYSIVMEMVVLALFLFLLGSAAGPLVSGRLAGLFWGGLVVAGLVVPLLLELVGPRAKAAAAAGAILVLAGGFVLRYVVLMSIHA